MAFINIKKGLQADYDKIATKNDGTIYITTDTKRIYIGANEYTRPTDTALSSSSTNAIANKAVNTALGKKLSRSGGTMTGNLYSTKAIHLYGADAYITLGLTKDGTSKCYIQTEGTSDDDLTAGFGFSWNKSLIIDQSGNITLPAGLKLPTSSNGTTLGLGSAGQVIKSNGTTIYWANDNNTTYSAATASAAGLMSAADKSKLDAITASADAVAFTRTRTSGDKIGTLSINGDATDLYSIAYTASKGIKLNGVNFEHTNSITAKTAYATSSTNLTPGYGGSFTVYEPKYDAQGHITGVQSISVAMPGAQSIPSLSGGSAASADTSVVGGVTVNGHAITVGKKTLTAGDNVTITGDKTSITISSTDTDTHWTTSLYATSASGTKNAATANGATYLRLFDNSTARSSINIKGSGSVSVASNDAGIITISGTDTDTTYSAGTGLALSGTTFNHSNSITAKTTYNQSTASPGYGGTFKITEPKYDAQGHITGVQVATITMPAAQTIPSLSGGDAASADASVVGGVTVNGHTITIGKKTLTAGDNVTITGDASSITISSKDTNTHYKTYLYATGASGKANAATSNGNTYLRIFDNTTARSSINVKGTGSVSVSSDANGVITITGTDTDTTYTASDGITLNGTVFKHSNAITAKTTYNQNTASPGYGGTFKITEPKYDAQGHITGVQVATITMPSAQTIPSLSGGTAASADASVIGGVTVSGHAVTASKKTLTAGDNVTITGDTSSITISAKDTHYTTKLFATSSSGTAHAATSNGATYLRLFDNSTARQSIKIVGSGATTVSSDASGVITINSTDTIPTIPTALKNPKALKFGSKSYDGSAEKTITAADLGLSSAMKYLGTTTTEISDGSITSSVVIGGSTIAVTNGNVVIYGSKEFIWNGSAWEEFGNEGNYKVVQTSVADPTASGTGTTFIATISQDTNGKITATKKTIVDNNTTYTIATGDNNGQIKVTPSSGSAYNVAVKGLTAAAYKSVSDSTSAQAIGTSANLVTERDVYFGLPTINNSHIYNSSTTIYAPTAGGTAGYTLIGKGTTTAPAWDNTLTITPDVGANVNKSLSLDNKVKFVYNSTDKCVDVIFI